MTLTKDNLCAFAEGSEQNRIVALKELLGYPVVQRDPQSGNFWYLRPGEDEDEALETCPIAVGFFSELNESTEQEIKQLLIKDKKQSVYTHYTNRVAEQQPVMYILLPTEQNTGRIPLVLPTEGGLRGRQVQTFRWNDAELIARLNRLKQGELSIAECPSCYVPQVDYVFYPAVETSAELAKELASSAREIEKVISKAFNTKKANDYLQRLFKSFQNELLRTLKPTSDNEKDYSFADIYAQTITYALFTARVFSYIKDKREGTFTHFDRESAWERLPETNPFLRKLFKDISEQKAEDLGDELIAAINDIFGILRAARMSAILSDFESNTNREDIVIRFYENFLAEYNPQMREGRGVYYTPEPVVSYIVRSVDHILKQDFNLKDGLADATKVQVENGENKAETHKVLITDIATGTGTFLHSVINHIHQSLNVSTDEWSDYVSQHLLPRVLGFELLMAPYAVAHMKLGLQLAELGYKFDTSERLRVYLTNTLQEAFKIPVASKFDKWIRDEADAANIIKQEAPVMVIMGNPPYSGHSANNGIWISNLLKGKDTITEKITSNYFEVDGKNLTDKGGLKWLNDDYVKFIRFAQWRIEQTGYGILGFITNHGFLDNPTFRGMRQSLMHTFDDIYILDLHGNVKKKEKCLDGSKDENVFDIQQGVAISIFVKRQNNKDRNTTIYHADLYGLRNQKYNWLNLHAVNNTEWHQLHPQSPQYLFIPINNQVKSEYDIGWRIPDIFSMNGDPAPGFLTTHDQFAISWSAEEAISKVEQLLKTKTETEARAIFRLCSQNQWQYNRTKVELKDGRWYSDVKEVLYRPFDFRWTVFNRNVTVHRRERVMQHMIAGENLALITSRLTKGETFKHAEVTDKVAEVIFLSPKTSNNAFVFPLYLYSNSNNSQKSILKQQRHPNLSPDFLNSINLKFGYTPTPEAIFYYIYAILHSPTYRARYAEFLKIDFPCVPLTSNNELFCQLAQYGEELVALHLMKSPKLDKHITKFVESKGNRAVDAGHPKYSNGAAIINKLGDKFTGVPEEVWNFYVGGYQVCQKWLKDRKGRRLSDEDIQHYQRIVVALKETIALMKKIDDTIPGFPIQ